MDCLFLIPHAFERQVLLVSEPEGYSLPRWTPPETPEHQRALLLNQTVYEQFGLATAVLSIVPVGTERLVVFDTLHPSDELLPVGRWIDAEECVSCPLAEPAQRAILGAWFAGAEEGPRMLWQKRGWFAEAAHWMSRQLEQRNLALQAPVEQLYTKYGACMLRAQTTNGAAYLKALPPSFQREPLLAAYLSQHFPGLVPHVLAIDETRNWLLTQHAAGTLLSELGDVRAWERALSAFAELQIGCVGREEDVLTTGCPDLRLSAIGMQLEPMLNDHAALRVDQPGGLSSEQLARLRARVPELQAACKCLADYGIPETLEHGDFNPSNIFVHEERITYLDWTDASLAHPFFSVLRLLSYFLPAALKERHLDLIQRLRFAYLEPWTIYAPMSRLLEALTCASTPMLLHRALNYYLLDFTRQGILWERSMVVVRHLQALA